MPEKESDEVTMQDLVAKFKDWIVYMKTQYLKILVICAISIVVSVVIAWRAPVTYTARMSFILDGAPTAAAGGGGYSGLASQFGLNMGGGLNNTANDYITGNNLQVFLTSFNICSKVLLTYYDSVQQITLAEKYLVLYEMTEKDKEAIPGYYRKIFASGNDDTLNGSKNHLLEAIIARIVKNELKIAPVKESAFKEVKVQMLDERLAVLFCRRMFSIAIDEYIDMKTHKQQRNVKRLQKTSDSLRALLNNKSVASSNIQLDLYGANPAMRTGSAEIEMNSRDKQLLSSLYFQVATQLDQSKMELSQETPNIQTLDNIILPLIPERSSLPRSAVLGLLIGLFISAALLTLTKYFSHH